MTALIRNVYIVHGSRKAWFPAILGYIVYTRVCELLTAIFCRSDAPVYSALSVRLNGDRVYFKSLARTAVVLNEIHLASLRLHNFFDLSALRTHDEHRLEGPSLSVLCVVLADFRCHAVGGAWAEDKTSYLSAVENMYDKPV